MRLGHVLGCRRCGRVVIKRHGIAAQIEQRAGKQIYAPRFFGAVSHRYFPQFAQLARVHRVVYAHLYAVLLRFHAAEKLRVRTRKFIGQNAARISAGRKVIARIFVAHVQHRRFLGI